jgi:hypothetical protein
MRILATLLLLTLPTATLAQRAVEDNRIVSLALPAATIVVDPSFQYAGAQTFELHEVATAEQHFFVDLDGTRVKRLLYVQFEGFHEGTDNVYTYSGETVELAGQTWYRGTATVRLPEIEPRPDSDGARARTFLREQGWTLGPEIVSQRLVWLLDDPPRNEVLVFYTEDLADHGLSAAEIRRGGPAHDRWPAMNALLHERATAAFTLITE